MELARLLDELPEDLQRQVFTHASWTERSSDSYTRLAFLGDSVLGLAITSHFYPRLEAERYGAGRLTKIRAATVSGAACREVAMRLSVPARLTAAAPQDALVGSLVETERVLASIVEAVIGAIYLEHGYDKTAAAVVEAFAPEIDAALTFPVDFKSTLQERLARHGATVVYEVVAEHGPAHDRLFDVRALIDGKQAGSGSGRSKKHAEQAAAREALDALDADAPAKEHPTTHSG
ncbi:MAG TPA: putative dsRNA-binding protein [Baekduia sp.]|nr:putative dsRNA-binding protein [Baekduia sp.]